jgi:hypothetical protein
MDGRPVRGRPSSSLFEKERSVTVPFPNESPEYRAARDALLEREIGLRREMEAVAVQLRASRQDFLQGE